MLVALGVGIVHFLRVLRELNSLEELGVSVKDLLFLAENIHIFEHSFTITSKPASFSEVIQKSDALSKVRAQTLLNQD
jgi:hypothetical protein